MLYFSTSESNLYHVIWSRMVHFCFAMYGSIGRICTVQENSLKENIATLCYWKKISNFKMHSYIILWPPYAYYSPKMYVTVYITTIMKNMFVFKFIQQNLTYFVTELQLLVCLIFVIFIHLNLHDSVFTPAMLCCV